MSDRAHAVSGPLPFRAAETVAWIAAVFCLIVSGTLAIQRIRASNTSTWKSPELETLKQKLRVSPKDGGLQEQIRRLDRELRHRYFRRLALTGAGSYLLLGGAVVLVIATKRAAGLRKKLPMPLPKAETTEPNPGVSARLRWSVAAAGLGLAVGLGTLIVATPTSLPGSSAEIEKVIGMGAASDKQSTNSAPTLEEMRAHWPQFRGADTSGVTIQTNLPLAWDVKTGDGILWKSAIPLPGFSSPIVWNNRVFLSSGDENRRAVLCFDVASGQLLWDRTIAAPAGSSTQLPESPLQAGFAAATMATDGQRVYAIFATGELVALDFEGKTVWSKNLGLPKNNYGHSSSLLMWRGSVLLQLDQGDTEERKSRLYAFDGATGRILWQRQRPVSTSWASPIVVTAAEKSQVITLGVPWLIAYAANDGTELWRAECLNGEITPSPIFAGGLVLAVSPSEKLLAIRPDGQGDVSKTHVVWTAEDNIPDITCPVSNGELVFTLTTPGMLTCYEVKSGKKLWEHDLEMEFQASPSIADNRLYLLGMKGTVMVVEATREFKELARSEMGEGIVASPAFAKDRIYLRTATNLFAIGPKEQKAASTDSSKDSAIAAKHASFPLTPALSLGERENRIPRRERRHASDLPNTAVLVLSPWGEGQGEGQGAVNGLVVSDFVWCLVLPRAFITRDKCSSDRGTSAAGWGCVDSAKSSKPGFQSWRISI
ncbi:MAG: PQQ-binding-like beta-propeller repeat protein [Verrucomicrobia bacterium]|nr:PQQ-binding-like beta-propeller repeat protein [Verrucomicrobiota bacterium]